MSVTTSSAWKLPLADVVVAHLRPVALTAVAEDPVVCGDPSRRDRSRLEASNSTCSGMCPELGLAVNAAFGGWLTWPAVTLFVVVSLSKLSVTVCVTVYAPAVSYVCAAFAPEPVAPSPKSQRTVSASPSLLVDRRGEVQLARVGRGRLASNEADGGWFVSPATAEALRANASVGSSVGSSPSARPRSASASVESDVSPEAERSRE